MCLPWNFQSCKIISEAHTKGHIENWKEFINERCVPDRRCGNDYCVWGIAGPKICSQCGKLFTGLKCPDNNTKHSWTNGWQEHE